MHSDHKYIEALRANDPRGIREIYQRYSAEALRWVLNNNGSADDARDIFQEAVMTLFEKARDTAFVLTCPLGAMLYVLYSRKWIDRLRAKKREAGVRIEEELRYKSETTSDVLAAAEDALEAAKTESKLAAAFQKLSDLCQRLLRLLVEGLPPREAAEKLEMNSVDTLYRRKNACVARWRELVSE